MTYGNSLALRNEPARKKTGQIVVVGSRGFLGRQIVSRLAGSGLNVIGTARDSGGDSRAVAVDLVGDSMSALRATFDSIEPEVIVNCTGRTSGSAQELIEANVVAPTRLLAAVAAWSPRLVHLGSAAEYGPSGEVGEPVTEDRHCRPESCYGITKLAGTHAILAQSQDSGVDSVVLRVFNPVGAGCPVSTLPGRIADLLRTNPPGEPLRLGPLNTYRDFVGVSDICAAVLACVRSATLSSRVYNVGSGRATATRELVHRLIDLAGFAGEVIEQQESSDRSAAVSWQQADITRAEAELGWTPTCDLDESLGDLWYRAL